MNASHGNEHSETCGFSQCGHSPVTDMLTASNPRLSEGSDGTPMSTLQTWASRERSNSIERPKWAFTTPAVVNL